ncbi:amino acid ABC transporter permease [Vaginisenegalia massiliensis]|uniref:amino acid ABC transporter permease n=1 Tax=Vaginisenegalia massiliensis TaxID=2058294 RepID=UPI000F547995|nr:amino acid ABC transporter permease [Vaginisenegalia massiliensis]
MQAFLQTMYQILMENWPSYLKGTAYTLLITFIGTSIGVFIGIMVGIVKTYPDSKIPWKQRLLTIADKLLDAYVAIFRGTPMIVQAMIIYYGTAILWDWNISPLQAAFLIVSINTGAYMAEIIRGGIISVDHGQYEAAQTIGMTHMQAMQEIVMPQVFRNALPAIGNEFVINVKDTSVLNVISVNELFFTSKTVAGTNYRFFETFLLTAIIYFILTVTITWLLRRLEKRMDAVSDPYIGSGQQQLKVAPKVKVKGGVK